MSPDQAIAALDRQIALHGQDVVLRRGATDYPMRGWVRGYRPDELAGGIQQGDSDVVLSPTGLAAAGFPDRPKRGDKLLTTGRLRNVEYADPVQIGGKTVRHNLQVRG